MSEVILLTVCNFCGKPQSCIKNGVEYHCKKDGDKCLSTQQYCPIVRKDAGFRTSYCPACNQEIIDDVAKLGL